MMADEDMQYQEAGVASKSSRKRDMAALQALGERLIPLSAAQLESLPLPEQLRNAIRECQRLKAPGALRRQRQYIGALMRQVDAVPIRDALEKLEQPHREKGALFRRVESWRDRLLAGDDSVAREVVAACPAIDSGELMRLTAAASAAANSYARRKLFRFIMAAAEASAVDRSGR